MRRVDDRHIHPCLNTVIEENAVDHRAGSFAQPKGDIAHTQGSENTGIFSLDQLDPFNGIFC